MYSSPNRTIGYLSRIAFPCQQRSESPGLDGGIKTLHPAQPGIDERAGGHSFTLGVDALGHLRDHRWVDPPAVKLHRDRPSGQPTFDVAGSREVRRERNIIDQTYLAEPI